MEREISHTSLLRASVTKVAFSRSPGAAMLGRFDCELVCGFGEVFFSEELSVCFGAAELADSASGTFSSCPNPGTLVGCVTVVCGLLPHLLACSFSMSLADLTPSSTADEEEDEMKKMTIRATKAKIMYRRYLCEPAISPSGSRVSLLRDSCVRCDEPRDALVRCCLRSRTVVAKLSRGNPD